MARFAGARLGNYELIERISGDGMAEVYRARQLTAFGREVAMKIILPDFSEQWEFRIRFLREAQAISRFSHPNILPLIEFGEADQTLYLVVPLVRAGTLRDLLSQYNGPLPLNEAVPLFIQLCKAVYYAHTQGIIHRDLKPQHVLLQEGSRVLLADFGIALAPEQTRLTITRAGVGTVEYMAPEQAQGQTDERSDIYSLGIILYQMLTGIVPYSGSTPRQVLMKHVQEPLPDPRLLNPSLPPRLAQALQTALAKDPNARFQDVRALGLGVQQARQEAQSQAGPRPSGWQGGMQHDSRVSGRQTGTPSLSEPQPFGGQGGMPSQSGLRPSGWQSGPGAGHSPQGVSSADAPSAPFAPRSLRSYASPPPSMWPNNAPGASIDPSSGAYSSGAYPPSMEANHYGPTPAETINPFGPPSGALYPPPGAGPAQSGFGAPSPRFSPPFAPPGAPPFTQPGPPFAPGYPPPGFPEMPEEPPQQGRNALGMSILSLITILVLLGGGLLVAGIIGKGPLASLNGQPAGTGAAQTPAASPTPTATPTPSAPPGFRVFINATNTFSIDYPSNWQEAKASAGSGAQFEGPEPQVFIVSDAGASGGDPALFDKDFCDGFGGKPTAPKQVSIAGQQWTEEECNSSSGTAHAAVEATFYTGHLYVIAYACYKATFAANRNQYFTPMEQSFKFLA